MNPAAQFCFVAAVVVVGTFAAVAAVRWAERHRGGRIDRSLEFFGGEM